MKKLEKYKIAPQAKFVKFKSSILRKYQQFLMIKQVLPARLPKIILPLNVSPPWNLKFSSCTPCLADDTIIPPLIPGERGGHYEYCCCLTISGFFVFC